MVEYLRDDFRVGVFGYYDVVCEEEIIDGLSNMIMIVGMG